MRQLAKSGRVKQPTDEQVRFLPIVHIFTPTFTPFDSLTEPTSIYRVLGADLGLFWQQIETMLSQADEESDGEIDFDEFCDLIANCDLHPTTLTRCEQSQYLLSEDFYFGEPRPEDGDGQRPDTFRGRMAARDEAAIHMSFAMVASGAPLQTVLSTLGAVVWLGVNDQRDGTQNAMIVGAIHVVATSFAVTIGCASRPAAKWAFAVYLVWEVAGVVVVLMALGALGDATSSQCSLSPPGGAAAVSTEHACPQLIVGAGSIGDAKTQCVNDLTQVHCEWSDKCVFGTEASCAAITPLGTCDYVSGECQVADDTVPFRQHGALDLWGAFSSLIADVSRPARLVTGILSTDGLRFQLTAEMLRVRVRVVCLLCRDVLADGRLQLPRLSEFCWLGLCLRRGIDRARHRVHPGRLTKSTGPAAHQQDSAEVRFLFGRLLSSRFLRV